MGWNTSLWLREKATKAGKRANAGLYLVDGEKLDERTGLYALYHLLPPN